MKNVIKEILREGLDKNSLGVAVTRPSQELIIMRGIPGSGKSTKAFELAGSNGAVHSTDTVIESQGDYNTFFKLMKESEDSTPLLRAHSTNFKNTMSSLKEGVSPVVFDNTNIKMNDPKEIVKSALKLGLADANIKIVDIGANGLTAKQLAERNTHGVPLETIEKMINSHKGQGEMTLKKILESKDKFKDSGVLYSCVLLDKQSHDKLLVPSNYAYVEPPDGWRVFCHHMTIAFGKGVKDKSELGKTVTLTATHVGVSDMAIAVRVEGYPSDNKIPHITMFVNPDGGSPVMSNDITKWQNIKPLMLTGVVTEIMKTNGQEK